jgi:hypothetical protein
MMNAPMQDYFTISRFEAADLEPALFDHEAHIYVAWLYLGEYPRDQAITSFDAALRRLTKKIGAESKYNAMITWLFLLLIAERMITGEDWSAFRARNTDLFDDRPRAQAA